MPIPDYLKAAFAGKSKIPDYLASAFPNKPVPVVAPPAQTITRSATTNSNLPNFPALNAASHPTYKQIMSTPAPKLTAQQQHDADAQAAGPMTHNPLEQWRVMLFGTPAEKKKFKLQLDYVTPPKPASAPAAAVLGALNDLGAGNLTTAMTGDDRLQRYFEAAQQQHPVAYGAGSIAGYIAPGSLVDKGVSMAARPLLEKVGTTIAGKIASRAATAAVSNAALFGASDKLQGVSNSQTLKDMALQGLVGGALGGGMSAIGARSAIKTATRELGAKGLVTPASKIPSNIAKAAEDRAVANATKTFGIGKEPALTPTAAKLSPVVNDVVKANTALTKAQVGAGNVLKPINTIDKIVSGKPTLLQNMKTTLTPTAGRPKAILSDLYQRFVNVQNPTKAFSKAAGAKVASENPYILSMNASNSGGVSNFILNEGLADKSGNIIGKSFKDVTAEIPKTQQNAFEDYLLNKHNISRTAEGKPVFTTDINGNKVDSTVSKQVVAAYEKDHPNFKTASENLQKWWGSFIDEWGVNSGLISEDTAKVMRKTYPDYVPTYRDFADIERTSGVKGAKSEFVNQSNTLKKATGSDRNVISPMQSFTQLVQKMVKASKYNEVGQAIVKAIKKSPDELRAFAEIVPEKDSFNLGNNLENGIDELSVQWKNATSDLSKNNIVRVMVGGEPVHIQINDKSFLRALTGADQQPSANLAAKVLRKGTGTYKALITGDNPLFALTNIARDVPTYLINGTENNPIKALGTLGKAAKGVLTNSKEFQEYKALGGGGGGFFKQDYASLGKKGGLISKVEKFNNATEQTPRFAEYLSTKNKLGNTYDAKVQGLYNANDVTTNFARHGDVTKSVDMGVPYLNPGVQGLDKIIRQVVTHPVGTLVKGVVAVTLPTVALDAINWNNPNYQALDNRTKDNYFLIPNGLDKDANGQAKTFIKIPKSREFGVLFGSLAERITRQVMGQPNSFKGFGSSAMSNIAPANPISSNFFTPVATLATGGNKDWAGRPIVPAALQNLSPKNQYDEKTSEIAKSLGNMTGMSPKQIDYLITSYMGVIGQLGLPFATKSSYGSNVGGNLLSPVTRKFTSDPLYSNQAVQDFYDNAQKAKTAAADKNFSLGANSQTTPEDTINSQFTAAQTKMLALQKQINALNSGGDLQKQSKILSLRQQMVQTATDANSLMTGKLTPQQSLANSLSQFSASKTNKSDEIKQYVIQNPSIGAGTLSSKFSISITQSRDVVRSVKDSSTTSTYSESVKKYLGLSKADMLKYYDALDPQSKALLDSQLSASGLNRYGNKK
jgi:hypothetical protein